MKKYLLIVVILMSTLRLCKSERPLPFAITIEQKDFTVQSSNGFEISSVSVYFNGQGWGYDRYQNIISCVFTPEVYDKEIEFRIWMKDGIGLAGDNLRIDQSVLVSEVEFIGNSAPYSGIDVSLKIPPIISATTNFSATLIVYSEMEKVGQVDIQIRIDTVGPPAQ